MKTYVYACKSGDRIKIGVSADVRRRVRDIGAHLKTPPVMIGAVAGDYHVEKFIHAQLSAHRRRGEWFLDCVEVRSFLDRFFKEGVGGIGYVAPPPRKKTFVPTPPKRENILAARRLFASWIWPDDAAAGLAELAGVSIEQADTWLRGDEEPPLLVTKAFGYEAMQILARSSSKSQNGSEA